MNDLESISEENRDQIRKYLRFFNQKKDGLMRTIVNEFTDAKTDKLYEDMYSKEDVEDFCDFLSNIVKNNVSVEVGLIINMSALAVSQLLEGAQESGVDLVLETAAVEDQALLHAVEKVGLESLPKNPPRRGIIPLTSHKDDAKAQKDVTNLLHEKNKKLQNEIYPLTIKLELSDQELKNAKKSYNTKNENSYSEGKNNENNEKYVKNESQRIRDLEQLLSDCREEIDLKLSETPQYQQMKKLMQSQSGKIRDMRRRLERYEPDNVKEDDDP